VKRRGAVWMIEPGMAEGPGGASARGFTLLEVLVALTVLGVGAAITMSLISGSLGNIRKVQMRTRVIEHAEAVMELALLDETIRQPATLDGDFEDGTRWTVYVEEYTLPENLELTEEQLRGMPLKLLQYTVEMFAPDSGAASYRLQTLKLVSTLEENQPAR